VPARPSATLASDRTAASHRRRALASRGYRVRPRATLWADGSRGRDAGCCFHWKEEPDGRLARPLPVLKGGRDPNAAAGACFATRAVEPQLAGSWSTVQADRESASAARPGEAGVSPAETRPLCSSSRARVSRMPPETAASTKGAVRRAVGDRCDTTPRRAGLDHQGGPPSRWSPMSSPRASSRGSSCVAVNIQRTSRRTTAHRLGGRRPVPADAGTTTSRAHDGAAGLSAPTRVGGVPPGTRSGAVNETRGRPCRSPIARR
jgi:hypothetical protein